MANPSVFISYASADGPIAQRVCELLEGRGISCWIAPRNVEAGADYGQAIIEGIKKSRVMLVLLSAESGASRYVAREVERAVTHHVTLLPVRLAPMDIPAQLEFFLGSCQWFDLFPPAPAQQLDRLADAVGRLLTTAEEGGRAPVKSTPVANPLRPRRAWLIATGLTLATASGVAYWMLRQPNPAVPPLSAGPLNAALTLTAPDPNAACLGSTQLEWSEKGLKIDDLDGFEVDLAKELVTRIIRRRDPNAKLVFVPHATRWISSGDDGKPVRFLNLLRRDSSVDLLASGISITAERQREGLAFTSPVLTCPQTLITLKDVAGFVDGKPTFLRLGAVDGTTNMALARQFQKAIPELEVIPFTGSGAHEKMLKSLLETREIDGGLADKPLAFKKIKNFQGEGADAEFNTVDIHEIGGKPVPPEQIAFVLRPGDVELKEALNREIADTRELRRDLVKKYFPTLDPATEVP